MLEVHREYRNYHFKLRYFYVLSVECWYCFKDFRMFNFLDSSGSIIKWKTGSRRNFKLEFCKETKRKTKSDFTEISIAIDFFISLFLRTRTKLSSIFFFFWRGGDSRESSLNSVNGRSVLILYYVLQLIHQWIYT